jgi:uncharacterized protein (TIGR02271 family)
VNDPDRREKHESGGEEGGFVVRHEEELHLGTEVREYGAVRVGKRVQGEPVREVVPRSIEHLDDVERTGPNEHDSGEVEVFPDGSVSIPILEEELVVSKRTVVRERVIVRKRTETRDERVEAELRKEKVQVDPDAGVELAEEELRGESE